MVSLESFSLIFHIFKSNSYFFTEFLRIFLFSEMIQCLLPISTIELSLSSRRFGSLRFENQFSANRKQFYFFFPFLNLQFSVIFHQSLIDFGHQSLVFWDFFRSFLEMIVFFDHFSKMIEKKHQNWANHFSKWSKKLGKT